MASFSKFLPILKKLEGGYVSASTAASINDTGGETYAGVARNFHPGWKGWPIVDAEKAKKGGKLPHNYKIKGNSKLDGFIDDFYKSEFWDRLQGDKISNQSLANFMVDWAVNSGTGTPVKTVQKILGLAVDGGLGKNTIAAINKANQSQLFDKMKDARRSFIQSIKKFTQETKDILIRDRVDSFFFSKSFGIGLGIALALAGTLGLYVWQKNKSQ